MIQKSSLPVSKASQVFSVTPRAYSKWLHRKEPTDSNLKIRKDIHSITLKFPKYGYRKVTHALRRKGEEVNHKRILRIMREENLLVRRKKSTPKTTQSNHNLPRCKNLAKEVMVNAPNQVWVSDITYVSLEGGFVYLALIMDLFSRRIVGWDLSRDVDTNLTLNALNKAVMLRGIKKVKGCIHHSDHGVQYLSGAYTKKLHKLGMLPSMGEIGNSYDNAHAESLNKTIKNEEVWINEYQTLEELYHNIKEFIELYNKKRLHSSIGYKPPIEFEQQQKINTKLVA
jgi:putative transposase